MDAAQMGQSVIGDLITIKVQWELYFSQLIINIR